MKTLLLICAESEARVSQRFLNAVIDAQIADYVAGIAFGELEDRVRATEGVDEIVVFPALIALPNALRENLLQRIRCLENENAHMRILMANPLNSDPRLLDMIKDRMATARQIARDAPILTIDAPDGSRSLNYVDFATRLNQIPDVSALVPNYRGQGVWVREILDHKANADAIFYADDDRFSATIDLALVRAQGVLIYGLSGQPLPASYGGPLRLMIPGYDDRCANVKGVARVEIVLR